MPPKKNIKAGQSDCRGPNWSNCTVEMLKQALKDKEMRVSGRKKDLIERLKGKDTSKKTEKKTTKKKTEKKTTKKKTEKKTTKKKTEKKTTKKKTEKKTTKKKTEKKTTKKKTEKKTTKKKTEKKTTKKKPEKKTTKKKPEKICRGPNFEYCTVAMLKGEIYHRTGIKPKGLKAELVEQMKNLWKASGQKSCSPLKLRTTKKKPTKTTKKKTPKTTKKKCVEPCPGPNWGECTVEMLKQALRVKNMKVSGNKQALIERLEDADKLSKKDVAKATKKKDAAKAKKKKDAAKKKKDADKAAKDAAKKVDTAKKKKKDADKAAKKAKKAVSPKVPKNSAKKKAADKAAKKKAADKAAKKKAKAAKKASDKAAKKKAKAAKKAEKKALKEAEFPDALIAMYTTGKPAEYRVPNTLYIVGPDNDDILEEEIKDDVSFSFTIPLNPEWDLAKIKKYMNSLTKLIKESVVSDGHFREAYYISDENGIFYDKSMESSPEIMKLITKEIKSVFEREGTQRFYHQHIHKHNETPHRLTGKYKPTQKLTKRTGGKGMLYVSKFGGRTDGRGGKWIFGADDPQMDRRQVRSIKLPYNTSVGEHKFVSRCNDDPSQCDCQELRRRLKMYGAWRPHMSRQDMIAQARGIRHVNQTIFIP